MTMYNFLMKKLWSDECVASLPLEMDVRSARAVPSTVYLAA